MYLDEQIDLILYNVWNKQTNIFIEMVICVAAVCKSGSFDKFSRDENLKQQWLIKIKCKNIQSIQHARMCYAYYFG